MDCEHPLENRVIPCEETGRHVHPMATNSLVIGFGVLGTVLDHDVGNRNAREVDVREEEEVREEEREVVREEEREEGREVNVRGTVDPDWADHSSGEEFEQESERAPGDRLPLDNELDETFMNLALEVSKKSPDTSTKVGAVIVRDKTTLSQGWNCMPKGCESLPWSRQGNTVLDTKYPYVTHAVSNAVLDGLKRGVELEGATIYTTLFPGNECAKMIVNMDIAHLVYLSDKYKNRKFTMASKRLLKTKGVKYRCYTPKRLQAR